MRRNYLNPCYLASTHVGTPDPSSCSFYGEELLIYYALCACPEKNPTLHLHLLFGNHERELLTFTPHSWKGGARYRLMGSEYDCKEGVVTYKVELFADEELIETWCHPLWVEAIETRD